ncbi:helix-turn-helix transcriptional regulator [Kitasatospora aureofaciens]|uniref:helix-turn-helix domain-containing protein n=1 Tax=Kitasatospora aureofaciens TaxID=1894 RepID=UPI00340208C4
MSGIGRPERPLDRAAGPIAAFACDLRLLRESAGLTYRKLAEKAGYSHNALAQAAGGARFPSLDIVLAFAVACGGTEAEWKARWRDAKENIAQQASKPAERRELDRWVPVDESTAAGRFAAYLRTLYLVHERPIEIVASEIGRSVSVTRSWLDGRTLPVHEDLLALLKAFHAGPGGVAIARRLYDNVRDTTGQPNTRRPFRLSVQIHWRDRQWAVTLGTLSEAATR